MKTIIVLFFLFFMLTGCSPAQNNASNEQSYTKTESVKESPTPLELSTFKTTIYTKTDARQNNVKLTCSELNGTLVEPGMIFSFCDTLGPAKPEDGYQKADTFDADGDIYKEYGGGKCQVSSTLYNAVINLEGIEIVERHEHSNYVPYVEDNKDAAVAYGSVDFKFKNNNSYPIKIVANATDDEVIISIFRV